MQQVIYTDANEINMLLKGRAGRESFLQTKSQIQSISFISADKFKLWKVIPRGRAIKIACSLGDITFKEFQHKKYFELYLTMLRDYCHENRVTFHDFDT